MTKEDNCMYIVFNGDLLVDDFATLDEVYAYIMQTVIDIGSDVKLKIDGIGDGNAFKATITSKDSDVIIRYYEK